MNKASFWKGFGAGVLFTSIILGTSCLLRTSDSNIISQAKKLGMEFATEEKGVTTTEKSTQKPVSSVVPKQSVLPSATPAKDTPKASENPKVVPTPEKEQEKKKTKGAETPKSVMDKEKESMQKDIEASKNRLEIQKGDWSYAVSKRLQTMGIIDNASEFDQYLTQHGYSESIAAGSYSVSSKDTYKELAEKITGKK